MVLIPMGTAVTLTACGESTSPEVQMVETAFEPRELRVKAGITVTWVNKSSFVHTITNDPALVRDASLVSSPDGATFNSGNIAPEQTWTHTFQVAGEYHYACTPHELIGMTGVIIVEA
jgi:plastocyanin